MPDSGDQRVMMVTAMRAKTHASTERLAEVAPEAKRGYGRGAVHGAAAARATAGEGRGRVCLSRITFTSTMIPIFISFIQYYHLTS